MSISIGNSIRTALVPFTHTKMGNITILRAMKMAELEYEEPYLLRSFSCGEGRGEEETDRLVGQVLQRCNKDYRH